MTNQSVEFTSLERKARDAVNVAASRGYPLPAEYTSSVEIAKAAAAVRDALPPAVPAPPTKPAVVAGWVADLARARAEHTAAGQVAAELYERTNRDALRAAVDAVPGWAAKVTAEFGESAREFERLLATAPREVLGSSTADEMAAHTELLRAADALTLGALDRSRLSSLGDEYDDLAAEPIWLVLDPRGSVTLGKVLECLADFTGRLPTDVEGWAQVAALGLAMAEPGGIGARRERFSELRWASGMAADGGRQDKSIDDAAALVGQAPAMQGVSANPGYRL